MLYGVAIKSSKNKDNTFFCLPTTPRREGAWLDLVNPKKGNLPDKTVVCSDHFEEEYFDFSWKFQKELYYTDCPVEKSLMKMGFEGLY